MSAPFPDGAPNRGELRPYGPAALPMNPVVAAARQSAAIMIGGSWRRSSETPLRFRGSKRQWLPGLLSPDQTRVVAGGVDGTMTIGNLTLTEPQEVARLKGPPSNVNCLAFPADNNTLVALSTDAEGFRGLNVWRARSFAENAR
jgi:hypothetical protein